MELRVQPLEKTLYPAAGTKISAGAADPARSDLSAAVLCAEVLTGAGMYWNQNRPELNLVLPGRNL